jgi:MFS family permease
MRQHPLRARPRAVVPAPARRRSQGIPADLASAASPAAAIDERRFLILVACAGIGLGMTAPLTALFAVELGASDAIAGLAVSSAAVSLLAVDLLGTRVVPRLGPRAVFTVALTVFGAGSLATAVAPNLLAMIAARMFQGLGAAVFMGGGLQVAVRLSSPQQRGRAIGAFNAAWFTGIATSPLLGGVITDLVDGRAGYRVAFAACAVVCTSVAIVAHHSLPPARDGLPLEVVRPSRPVTRRGARLGGPLALSSLGQAVRGGVVFTVLPLFARDELHLSTASVGVALSVLAIVDIVLMRVGGALADRVGRVPVLVVALLVGAVVCTTAPLVGSVATFALFGAGLAVTVAVTWVVPAAMVVDAVEDPESGVSAYRTASDVGMAVGPLVAGALVGAAGHPASLLCVGGVFALAGLATAASGLRRPPHDLEVGQPVAG